MMPTVCIKLHKIARMRILLKLNLFFLITSLSVKQYTLDCAGIMAAGNWKKLCYIIYTYKYEPMMIWFGTYVRRTLIITLEQKGLGKKLDAEMKKIG
jgi:hypothetical protein